MKPCLRERKPSLKYKFYEEYESDESAPTPESEESDADINYCHDCDLVFEDIQRLYKHLLRHIKQPKVEIVRLSVNAERAPIRITLKGCGSGDFEVVQSPASSAGAPSPVYNYKEFSPPFLREQQPNQGCVKTFDTTSGKTDDDYEEKYIIPDSDPVAGGAGAAAAGSSGGGAEHGQPVQFVAKTEVEDEEEDDGHVDQQEEDEEEENAMNVSFSPNYANAEHMQQEENSLESQLSSNRTTSDGGYGSSVPGAEPTPPPEPSPTPDHLMPKIRIKSSGLLMAPERESPQGLTITEITEAEDGPTAQEQDPFAGVDAWSGSAGATGMEDPLRLPDTIETDGNIISNLFTNNTDRAKDLGLTSSDSEFIALDGLGNSGGGNTNNTMAVYNPSQQAQQSSSLASVSSALVGLPMQQLAQQVSRLQQPSQGGQQMHQQNVLINIQQFPQAPPQQPPQVQQPPQQQVQPYGMYGHHYQGYQPGYHQPYGQPYQQPSLYYAAPPPAYPSVPPAQHMPPPAAPQQHPQQPQAAYILQPAPQQQQQPQQQPQQPIILGAVSQLSPAQQQQQGGQQVQQYGQQPQQVRYAVAGGQQQGPQQGQQLYNQGTYGQPAVHRPPQPGQPQPQGSAQQAVRMGAPRAPSQSVAGPRMATPRGGPSMVGTRAPYSPRGGSTAGRPPMVTRGGRGAPHMMQSMRGRPRTLLNHPQQNGMRNPANQTLGSSPVKRTPEQMAAIAAKRRRMESTQATATVKVEADDDDDDCEVVSVQQREANKLPKIQSVQGAVPESNSDSGGVMHLSDSITLSVRQPAPPPPSPKAKSDAKQVANVLAARGITVTAAPKETKQSSEPVPISLNKSMCIMQNKQQAHGNSGKKEDHTPTVDLTDEVRVPPPKTLPPASTNPSTNGGTSIASPPQPFKCDQCPARYGTNIALVKHRQLTHKNCNQMDYGVPLIDLRQPGIMGKLTNFGIYNYIPLPAANVSGMFALPVISMNAVKNNVNLSALGNSMLTLGPIRKIQKAGGGPGGAPNTQQSPPRGRPPSNPTTPTKQL